MDFFKTMSSLLFPSPPSTSISYLKEKDPNSKATERRLGYLERLIRDGTTKDQRPFSDPDLIWNRRWVDAMEFLKEQSERDYLVTNTGHKENLEVLDGKHVVIAGFFVPLISGSGESMSCHALIRNAGELVSKTCQVVIIILGIPGIKDEEKLFDHFFSGFPDNFLAIPFWDRAGRAAVFNSLCLSKYSSHAGVILDPQGRILDTSLSRLVVYGGDYYPFTRDRLSQLDEDDYKLQARLDNFSYSHVGPSDSLDISSLPLLSLAELLKCDPTDRILVRNNSLKPARLAALDGKVVMLYLCSDGTLMPTLLRLQVFCGEFTHPFELVVVPLALWDHPSACIDQIKLSFAELQISSWSLLHYDDVAIRTLWRICGKKAEDRLIILPRGKNHSGDPYADVVLSSCIGWNRKCLHFEKKIELLRLMHPFTRQRVCSVRFSFLRSVMLLPLLLEFRHDLFFCNGSRFPLTDILDKNVILYLNPNYGSSDFEDELSCMRHLYSEIQAAYPECLIVSVFSSGKPQVADTSDPDVPVIDLPAVKLGDVDVPVVEPEDSDVPVVKPGDAIVSDLPWVMIYPPKDADKSLRKKLFQVFLGESSKAGPVMVAFGVDGRICSRRCPQDSQSVISLFRQNLSQEIVEEVTNQVRDMI